MFFIFKIKRNPSFEAVLPKVKEFHYSVIICLCFVQVVGGQGGGVVLHFPSSYLHICFPEVIIRLETCSVFLSLLASDIGPLIPFYSDH